MWPLKFNKLPAPQLINQPDAHESMGQLPNPASARQQIASPRLLRLERW